MTGSDSWVGATSLPVGTYSFPTPNAALTTEVDEPAEYPWAGNSAWWRIDSTSDGYVFIDTLLSTGAGDPPDTVIEVYTGAALDALTLVADNDQYAYADTDLSGVILDAASGTTYWVKVAAATDDVTYVLRARAITVEAARTDLTPNELVHSPPTSPTSTSLLWDVRLDGAAWGADSPSLMATAGTHMWLATNAGGDLPDSTESAATRNYSANTSDWLVAEPEPTASPKDAFFAFGASASFSVFWRGAWLGVDGHPENEEVDPFQSAWFSVSDLPPDVWDSDADTWADPSIAEVIWGDMSFEGNPRVRLTGRTRKSNLGIDDPADQCDWVAVWKSVPYDAGAGDRGGLSTSVDPGNDEPAILSRTGMASLNTLDFTIPGNHGDTDVEYEVEAEFTDIPVWENPTEALLIALMPIDAYDGSDPQPAETRNQQAAINNDGFTIRQFWVQEFSILRLGEALPPYRFRPAQRLTQRADGRGIQPVPRTFPPSRARSPRRPTGFL